VTWFQSITRRTIVENIIVYVDDAAYAEQQLAPMKGGRPPCAGMTHWVLVACAPRLTRRIGKWVSHGARQSWRAIWAQKLFARTVPQLQAGGDRVTPVLADRPLPELTRRLMAEHGASRVLDARRPKFGQALQPVTADQPAGKDARWEVPGALAALGALLVLAEE
jgi:hypothetical protein